MQNWYRLIPSGIELSLYIQPNASKNEVVGVHGGKLKIKLTAPPSEGQANEGLIEFLSELFMTSKKNISLIKGQTSRHKLVRISSLKESTLQKIINEVLP